MKRGVVSEWPKRDSHILVDVAFPDLDKTTKLRETGKPHWDCLCRERVEHHVHPFAICQFQHRLSKVAATRIDHVFHPERFEQRTFTVATGSGDNFRAKVFRNLNRGHSNSTRTCMDQDTLARAEPRDVLQRMPRGHENDRQRCRCLECQGCWNTTHVASASNRMRGDPKHGEAEDAISCGQVRDIRADRLYDAANLVAKNASVQCIDGVECQ